MALPADSTQRAINSLRVNKDHAEKVGDPTGFRIDGERLVAKKKKKSPLKKLIIAEREVRKDSQSATAAPRPAEQAEEANASFSAFSVDAPEFVPTGWVSNAAAAESVAESKESAQAEAKDAAVAGDGGGEKRSRKLDEAKRKGPATAMQAPEFVPSWCQVPAELSHSGAAASSSSPGPAAECVEPGEEEEELLVSKAIERIAAQTKDEKSKSVQAKKEKKPHQATNLEVRHYVRQVLSDELDEKVKAMLADLARFQERARLDPAKFAKLKRFCIGMAETARSVKRGKAKCLIMAPNLDRSEADGGLDDTVEELMDLCFENEVPIVFALSRNRMGKALGKNIRMSIVCVLSAEGVHQELKQIVKLSEELRRQWVMRRAALGAQEVLAPGNKEDDGTAHQDLWDSEHDGINERVLRHLEENRLEEERRRAEAKAQRDLTKAADKERKQAERQAKQEERRTAQREEKEEEARKLEEEEKAKDEADVEKRKIAAVKEAGRQELIEKARKEKERRAEEERLRIAEMDAKAAAAAGIDSDDSDDDDLPAGFNADFF